MICYHLHPHDSRNYIHSSSNVPPPTPSSPCNSVNSQLQISSDLINRSQWSHSSALLLHLFSLCWGWASLRKTLYGLQLHSFINITINATFELIVTSKTRSGDDELLQMMGRWQAISSSLALWRKWESVSTKERRHWYRARPSDAGMCW